MRQSTTMRILSVADCQKPRSPRDLYDWVDRKNRALSQTRFGRNAVRLRKYKYAKWFMEEIFPLSRFGVLRFPGPTDVTIAPVRGSQRFDAIIQSETKLPYRRLEITHASQDRDEHLRMVHLARHGDVPLSGPVSARRDKFGNEVVDVIDEWSSAQEDRARILESILDRTKKKAAKTYAPDVALLVAFSPMSKPSTDDCDVLAEFAKEELRTYVGRFPDIFLVSTFGEYLGSVAEICSAA